ncbi:MAG: hypothetical protein WKF53_09935 [Rubrobacter sp.]
MRCRLERLENHSVSKRVYGAGMSARGWERYFHACENARRELRGLEPLPELTYTKEDREEDQRTLEETIPVYRNSGGWETEEARAFLDDWERRTRERTERNSNG